MGNLKKKKIKKFKMSVEYIATTNAPSAIGKFNHFFNKNYLIF
jgi:hypothetical protein